MIEPNDYARAHRLELRLGDPRCDDNPLSFRSACALDREERFPDVALQALCAAGLHREYVPKALGGALNSYEALLWQLRAVGRRDFTAAVAHAASFPPAFLVWCAGNDEQRRFVADLLLQQQALCIAFHERAHGNDFMASEVAAEPIATGYRLHGEKWGVANARRARCVVTLAKTAEDGGPRGFSLFLVDTDGAKPSLRYLDKIPTHGVRGLDIDGICFDGHEVPATALLDGLGRGFERSLTGSQVTRTLSLGPLLGALDTALRAAISHLAERQLYGAAALALPAVAAAVADAFSDLVLMESAALFTTRAIHFMPHRLMAWSAATKALVTLRAERTLSELSVLMGSRFYFRDVFWHGIFEKIVRDAPMARISHFGGVISLVQLGSLLPRVYGQAAFGDATASDLRATFDMSHPPPPANLDRLRLAAAKEDPVLASLGWFERALNSGTLDAHLGPQVRRSLQTELALLTAEVETVRSFLATLGASQGRSQGRAAEMLEVARRHAVLFAASSACMMWHENRDALDDFGRGGGWRLPTLRRARQALCPALEVRDAASDEALSRHALALVQQDRALSIFAPRVAPRGSASQLVQRSQ